MALAADPSDFYHTAQIGRVQIKRFGPGVGVIESDAGFGDGVRDHDGGGQLAA